MPAKKKRTRAAAKPSPTKTYPAGDFTLSLRETVESKDGFQWTTYLVQGWREEGTWKRRKFKARRDAEAFIDVKRAELENVSGATHRVATHLNLAQVKEAEGAFNRLGDRGTLEEAVTYFLSRVAAPAEPKALRSALMAFLVYKEHEKLRPQSLRQLESTCLRFVEAAEAAGLAHLHEIGCDAVDTFLRSLRAKNGVDPATPKTWNNYRADLSSWFNWCADPPRRWLQASPCAGIVKMKGAKETDPPEILTIRRAARVMRDAETFAGGKLARYLALALFAGIRPGGELVKLASHPDRDSFIDLKQGYITIPPSVSKTRDKRQIAIRENLRHWLETTDAEIIPKNADRLLKTFRKRHGLTHDVLRHCFISYHVALFRSVGEAAIEAGNSEGVVKKHYLNAATLAQGRAFWRIKPKGVKIGKPSPASEFRIVA